MCLLHRCGEVGIVKGQGHEQVQRGKIGMEQTAELSLCVALIQLLLDFCGRVLSLPSLLWMGVYWIDGYLQILPTIVFLLSVCSLHMFPSLYGCYVNILYKPVIGHRLRPFGKCFASKVDDENLTFILGERSQFGRAAEILDFCVLSEYNSVRQT